MECKRLYGVVCASITPMREDGSIDGEGVRRLTRHLIDCGIHCLYPNGTNGESLSLSQQEREEIARVMNEENAGRTALYLQCGAATVAESYAHIRFARELGADGAGLMTPCVFSGGSRGDAPLLFGHPQGSARLARSTPTTSLRARATT